MRFGNILVEGKHYRAAYKRVAREFINSFDDLDKKFNSNMFSKSSWFKYALAAEMLGYSAFDRYTQMLQEERKPQTGRRRPARSLEPSLVIRLIKQCDKLGGAAKQYQSNYLQNFYKVTKIPEITSVVRLGHQITEWKRMLNIKVRPHDAFEGSSKQKEYLARAAKKLQIKGYKGIR